MGSYKLVFLLISVVAYVNYENYFAYNIGQLQSKAELLKNKLAYEKTLQEGSYTMDELQKYEDRFFDGKQLSNSQAMGKMQGLIAAAAKGVCETKNISWGQVALQKSWYEKLRMNVSLSCTPTGFVNFSNTLQENPEAFYFENLAITKDPKESKLNIGFQLVTFRTLR